MEQQILWDKDQYPSDEVIFSHIGKSKQFWISFFDYIHSAQLSGCSCVPNLEL